MKLSVKTAVLQEMLSKAVKGVGNNKFLPITSLLGIEYDGSEFVLITTDSTNYLYVRSGLVEAGEEFYVTVNADTFAKLISKTTSENVTLELMENYLEVTGNGTYKIELPFDESGNVIKYPNPIAKIKNVAVESGTIKYSTIKQIINSVKSSLATTADVPSYMNYYVKDKVVGTDTYKIACLNEEVFQSARLVSSNLMNLISVTDYTDIKYDIYDDGIMLFTADDITVYGKQAEGLNDYSISAIENLIDLTADGHCVVQKDTLLQVLDRLMLFVNPYDRNAINLKFKDNYLTVESLTSSGIESIKCDETNGIEFVCSVDIEMLCTQVKSIAGTTVDIYYGNSNALKLKNGNLIQIIALLESVE